MGRNSTIRKVIYLMVMTLVVFAFVFGMDWASAYSNNGDIISFIPLLFVLSMCHELMHALAWWYFGYSAIPIPILIPPIIGITIGEKPSRRYENILISLAPILLTFGGLIAYAITKNDFYAIWSGINAFGMVYDVFSIFEL